MLLDLIKGGFLQVTKQQVYKKANREEQRGVKYGGNRGV